MKNYQKTLEKIGLSTRESKIYLDILNHPHSSMIDISRRTGIHRPVLYTLLPLLKEKKLILIKKIGGRTYYNASPPSILQDQVLEIESKLLTIIPDLQQIYDSKGESINTIYYEGIEDIQKLYKDIVDLLPMNGEYFAYTGKNTNTDKKFFIKEFWEVRDKKKLKRYVIAPKERSLLFKNNPYREIAYFPEKKNQVFEKNIVKIIYANRVAIIDFSRITGIVIENPLLAMLEKQQFQMLFEFLRGEME